MCAQSAAGLPSSRVNSPAAARLPRPQVVRLAVEAQALSALLLLLAQAQHAAVDARDVGAAFKWADFEGTMQMALRTLQAQLQALTGVHGTPGSDAAAGSAPAGSFEGQAAQGVAGTAEEGAPAAPAAVGGPGNGAATGGGSSEEEGELPPPLPGSDQQNEPAAPHAGEAALLGAAPPLPAAPLPAAPLPAHPAALPHDLAPLPNESGTPLLPTAAPPLPNGATSSSTGAAAEHSSDADAAAVAEHRKRKAATEAAVTTAGSKKARGGTAPAASSAAGGRRLAKGAASLINKWQAVAKQVEEEEEAAAAAAAALEDPEAQRRREAEEWRLQQLRSGAADDNANFAVRGGGWCRLPWGRGTVGLGLGALPMRIASCIPCQGAGPPGRPRLGTCAPFGCLLCCHAVPPCAAIGACCLAPRFSGCSLWWVTGGSD